MTVEWVPRYRGAAGAGLVAIAVGLLLSSELLVALAAVPLGFVAYGALSGAPAAELEFERSVDPDRPAPDGPVTVELVVRNVGSSGCADLRVVDGAPDALPLLEGSPRAALALAPGESPTVEYVLAARRGEHGFERPVVRQRGVAGASYRDRRPPVEGDDAVAVDLFVDAAPTHDETATLAGVLPTDAGGSGVEFHTTREYRPGDPINRVDWQRLARDGDLATIDYREDRGAGVVVVVDCRTGFEAAGDVLPPADRCRYAGERLVRALDDAGHKVGLLALGPHATPWIELGTPDVVGRSRAALAALEAGDWTGSEFRDADVADGESLGDRLADRLPSGGQVVVVSPLLDDVVPAALERLAVRDYPGTVVAPDLGDPAEPAGRLTDLDRRTRLVRLRSNGTPTVEWPHHRELTAALAAHGGER